VPRWVANIERWRPLGDVHAQARDFHREAEVPFSSERKRMSVLVHHILLDRRALVTKGAPDVLLPRCISVLVGESVVPLDARTSGSRWASRAPR